MIAKAILILAAVLFLFIAFGSSAIERRLLFYPTHKPFEGDLAPWKDNGETIGYSREMSRPENVWLMLHGNAGQASDRAYAIPHFSQNDSVYLMEYPGYGQRTGTPSKKSFDQAAIEAYLLLRKTYPGIPVCVASESIGSGPASTLAALQHPPDKIILIVPFDKLSSVAKDHFPSFLVDLILKDDWDNVAFLSKYKGPVDIFGAKDDRIIPVSHAKALASAIPQAKLTIIPGGHNDWAREAVKIRNP